MPDTTPQVSQPNAEHGPTLLDLIDDAVQARLIAHGLISIDEDDDE